MCRKCGVKGNKCTREDAPELQGCFTVVTVKLLADLNKLRFVFIVIRMDRIRNKQMRGSAAVEKRIERKKGQMAFEFSTKANLKRRFNFLLFLIVVQSSPNCNGSHCSEGCDLLSRSGG